MELVHKISEMQALASAWRAAGLSVGLVPTMGSLHEGHMSLVRKSAEENDRTVVSVFVNPIQFGANEDFDRYPRDLSRDLSLCGRAGADAVFNPSAAEMYPEGFCSRVEMSVLTENLCGKTRPAHFRGVCTVVLKLFLAALPDRAYFGQKDAQQLAVVRRMARDFNMRIEVVGAPIVREADGLAMSSRNAYLTAAERAAAPCLFRALSGGAELCRRGVVEARGIERRVREILSETPLARVDYVEVVDAETMRPLETVAGPALCAAAVYIGETRLIDNIALEARAGH
ncbi:MAG: pantoate--beta-alanine ligase [Clostridiales Family XIII bacterium]|jgi:pantoate--beta-alanine ligase|nr:pantoate--beta-alanine ligase [Clostridiales Family XIII bacterium]